MSDPEPGATGHAAIVTGASRGIGRAIAVRLAADGADLALRQRGDAADAIVREAALDVSLTDFSRVVELNLISTFAVACAAARHEQTEAVRADPVRFRKITDRIPAGHWGRDEDVAEAVAWLVSPGAHHVHGHVLAVDGGWLGR